MSDSDLEIERDIHSLLALGVPLTKLEQLYGAKSARTAAQHFVTRDSADPKSDGKLRVGSEMLKRSPSAKDMARMRLRAPTRNSQMSVSV